MKCSKARLLLSALIDGEISPGERLLLRRHLAACPRCKEEKTELHTLRAFMSIWPEEDPPRPGRKPSPHRKLVG